MSEDDVEIIARETVFDGYFRIDRYKLRHGLHDGGMGGELVREVFERGHAVAVLLHDPGADAIVMVEQFRIGAHAAGWSPWLLEIPAGIIEAGEKPLEVAVRETREETGLSVQDIRPILRYLVSPGGTTESVELFYAVVDSADAGGIHGVKHEGEDIQVLVVPVEEALDKMRRGGITNAMTLIALQWLALNRAGL